MRSQDSHSAWLIFFSNKAVNQHAAKLIYNVSNLLLTSVDLVFAVKLINSASASASYTFDITRLNCEQDLTSHV